MSIIKQTRGIVRDTFINGVIFLIPLVALGWVFSGAISGIAGAIGGAQGSPWVRSHGGLVLLLPVIILATVFFVFILGLLVHVALLQRAKSWLEQQVLDLMPGYNFLKSMTEEKLHVKSKQGVPVLVQWPTSQQLGMMVDQKDGRAVVFFPNSTIFGGGAIHVVDMAQVTELPFSVTEFDDILIRSGNGLLDLIDYKDAG
jgi:uncharacterized membrane protein